MLIGTCGSNIPLQEKLDNIIPFYQPIVDKCNRVKGYEVLARRREGSSYLGINFSTMTPKEILSIDITMLRKILIDLPFLGELGINILSINLSPELDCPIYQELLLQVLLESKRYCIENWLEVLEFANIDESQKKILNKMIDFGARIACDDFGTLTCNFQRVLDFPYQIIKLDRSLLLKASDDIHAMQMLSGLVEYLQNLNIQTVCEGVESDTHRQIANQLMSEYQQGYIYGMPSLLASVNKPSLI
ncbi:EAL domain-containing protein [Vibrio cholerae]|uniref:EAL domain-containing protein n=2 Tax=Vibrio cholerae TaxID=666 RepID=UPI000322DFE1|nr:EAL domain-containing protein [Vibrio cholerae]EJL6306580.1 EAL domain-containing protein [Vibrio cholerae]EKF9440696.1 EAL domain-containing protein [Vibrio cholerae]ELJ8645618.1 EAL domain-containing protein [Vibrio cholerae]MCX9514555.1 EAL domain-containing protein [Vibrio cholerae]NOE61978.1 EAL domain-containing protein [Vibrio cholerae]